MLAVAAAFAAAGAGIACAQDRIVRGIDNGQIATVKGNVHPQARAEFDQGPADSALKLQGLTILFKPTAAQQAAADLAADRPMDRLFAARLGVQQRRSGHGRPRRRSGDEPDPHRRRRCGDRPRNV